GQTVDQATATLNAAGFAVGDAEHQYNDSVPDGGVIGTDPPGGTKVARDSVVRIVVSDGPQPVSIPDQAGKSFDDASQALSALGFKVARDDEFNLFVPMGKVIGTDPPAGQTAVPGTTITVQVSKGPEMVTVPNEVGQTLEAATADLQAKGFQVTTAGYL